MLVIDEADALDYGVEFEELVTRGRHYGVSMMLIALHPRLLSTDIRRQATEIISFRQIFPDDIDYLAQILGPDAYALKDFSGPPKLPPHPYLHWTPSDGAKIIQPENA